MNVDSPADSISAGTAPLAVSAAPKAAVTLNHVSTVLSFIGVFIASVLSMAHLWARSIPCGEDNGCGIVANNPASMLAGVPVAYLGLGAYVVLALLSIVRTLRGLGATKAIGIGALAVSGIGALFSFYLQFISFTQIHAVCYWCLASAITMSVLFLVQAGIAQMDIPKSAGASEGGLVFVVGLLLLTGLGVGYEAMSLLKSPPSRIVGGGEEVYKLLVTPDSMKLGPDTAQVKIVEFSDLLCPSCRAIYPDVKKLVADGNGNVQLILRHRPLTKNVLHTMAAPAAFFAEFGAQSGKGWPFVDRMYEHDVDDLQTIASIEAIAKQAGIDSKAALKRMNDTDPLWKRVMRDLDTATGLGVTETPTFFVLAKGLQPVQVAGRELLRTMDRPEYKALINPDAK